MGLERFLCTKRIRKIKRGVRRMGPFRFIDAFNRHTIQTDSNANTLSDRNIPLLQTDSNANARADPRHFASAAASDSAIQSSSAVHSYNWFIVGSHGPRDEEAQRDQDHHLNRPAPGYRMRSPASAAFTASE